MPHIHEKIDFVANVFIVNGNTVLLRKHDKYKVWLPPGGHVELDEDPTEAAVREMKEEVGLDVSLVSAMPINTERLSYADNEGKDLITPYFMNRHRISDTHEHISFEYFGTSETKSVVQGETELSDDIKWFTCEELNDPSYGIAETIRHYAKAALAALGS
ncbi:MAG: hydrolase [Parcubacteria group bacterium]|nr:hydrolase [Parcubacteria group bacterium]